MEMDKRFEKIYDGFPHENVYRKNLIDIIDKTNYNELKSISKKLDYGLSNYDILRIARAYKSSDKDLKEKIYYILKDINYDAMCNELISGNVNNIIKKTKNNIANQLKEEIINIFEKQLDRDRNNYEIEANSKYLIDYSLTELEFLVNQNILTIEQISKPTFKLEQTYIDKYLEKKWESLSDVPFTTENNYQILDGNYWDFKKGKTTNEDIWHYFDEHHSKGIYYLLYEYENEEEESL